MAFTAEGQWKPEDDGVVGRLRDLMATDSPMMRTATGIGSKVANRRGMINSSITTGETTKAAFGAAVPIASQEAQQTYGKNIQHMQGDQQSKINRENLAAAQQERLSAALAAAGGNYQSSIAQMLQNDKIGAADRSAFMRSAMDTMLAQIAAFERIYGVSLNWGTSPSSPATGPVPPGGGMGQAYA